MKLIEAMKKIKDLKVKAEDLRSKIASHSANLDFETTEYEDQAGQVRLWLQAHGDIIKEILHLRLQVAKTNLATKVDINIGGKVVTKTIAEWVHRRRDLAELERMAWAGLTDKGLKDQQIKSTPDAPITVVKVKRHFDPATRDSMVEMYRSEPNLIDATLEVVNATTDVVE